MLAPDPLSTTSAPCRSRRAASRDADNFVSTAKRPSCRPSSVQTRSSMKHEPRDERIWTLHGPRNIQGADIGPLQGLTFAVKDIYDVRGYVTGFGHPSWKASHLPAAATAPAVQALLDAGATLIGTTQLDELAFSLEGQNIHYGTPPNPACSGCIPGGSSSGSAAAVADGSVDFSLGTDTGGSVRVPASFCGILGLRPSWGRVSLKYTCTLADSFDTGGFFARKASVLCAVGNVLLNPSTCKILATRRWMICTDAFNLAQETTRLALYKAIQHNLRGIKAILGEPSEVHVATVPGGESLTDWAETFRITQGSEVWRALGSWLIEVKPELGAGTKRRLDMTAQLHPDEVKRAKDMRVLITEHIEKLLSHDAVLLLPSAPGPAAALGLTLDEMDSYRTTLLQLTSIAGLAGLPQVSLPIAMVDTCPVGLGLIGPRGSDEQLLRLSEQLMLIMIGN